MKKNINYLSGKLLNVVHLYFYNEEEVLRVEEIRKTFNISEKYEIIGRDTLVGDIIVLTKNQIHKIDHESPKDTPITITKDISKFCNFVDELEKYDGFFHDEKELKKLKKVKKQLKDLKKIAPSNLKHHFQNLIWDVEDLIEDIKDDSDSIYFPQTELEWYKATEKVKEIFTKEIGNPSRYRKIKIVRFVQENKIRFVGTCWKKDESISEIYEILKKMPPLLPIYIDYIRSYDDFLALPEEEKRKFESDKFI